MHNEELRATHPAFKATGTNRVVFLHCLTSITTVDQLINEAKSTKLYTIDTESQVIHHRTHGSVIQIQMMKSRDESTTILTEMFYLPRKNTLLYSKIKELYSIILRNDNTIISWGEYKDEFKHFHEYEFINSGNNIKPINLQLEFQKWHNEQAGMKNTHPVRESRGLVTENRVISGDKKEEETATMGKGCDCGHSSHYKPSDKWSLQDAIEKTTGEFLDKNERRGKWSCGLDLQLATWKKKTFGYHYDRTLEQQKRQNMSKYAVDDCLATTKLYFIMNPPATSKFYPETPPLTTTTSHSMYYELDDDSENETDEEIFRALTKIASIPRTTTLTETRTSRTIEPSKPTTLSQTNKQSDEQKISSRIIELTQLNLGLQSTDQHQRPKGNELTPEEIQSRKEKQKRKNEKFKEKKRSRSDFNNWLNRPIYYRYDYQKIRAQLADDDIHHSHQVNIHEEKGSVAINFTSKELLEQAKTKMHINYFSKSQYHKRWG